MPANLPVWTPNLFLKQFRIVNSKARSLLISGPRKGGKTIGASHKACRHLWETPGARLALIAKTKSSAKDGGVWVDVMDAVDEWTASGIGFDFTTINSQGIPGPKSDLVTKTDYFKVRNMYGGESEMLLFSLDHDRDVEAKLKSTRFSAIWFSELSLFKDPNVFRTSMLQLRMKHLKREQHFWMADTNPAEEGEDSWIYKQWFLELSKKDHKFPGWQKGLELIEIFLEDNPFLTKEDIEELHAQYADSPGDFDRLVKGIWTKGQGVKGMVFTDIFSKNIHVIGEPGEADTIEIANTTTELLGGWDIGSSVNHAWVAIEQRIIQEVSYWMVLAEVSNINKEESVEDFTVRVLEKMDAIQERYQRSFDWKHWSDTTAINVYRANGDTYDYLTVRAASDGRINLQGANKADGANKASVKMFRGMVKQNRFFVSQSCHYIWEMMQKLRYGVGKSSFIEASIYRHGWDACRYPIFMESLFDIQFGDEATPNATEMLPMSVAI